MDTVYVLLEPARASLSKIGEFVAILLGVIFILLIGWLVAIVIKAAVSKGLNALRLDDLSERFEIKNILAKGGIKYSFSELMGVICYWLILLVTLQFAVSAFGLTPAAQLLEVIISYIPNIIAAIFLLTIGIFSAALLKNIVMTAAVNAGLSQARTLARVVEIVIVVFAVFMSLEQLRIAPQTIDAIIKITLGSLGLAFAIAVGFGARDFAEKAINDLADKLKKK